MTDQSNIRNEDHFKEGFWEWSPYNDCFKSADGQPTGIRISDIDGHVERNGHFLWIETSQKSLISIGQRRSIKHRILRGDTVVIIQGKPNQPTRMIVHKPHDAKGTEYEGNERRLWRFFRGWMLWAEANGWIEPKHDSAIGITTAAPKLLPGPES